MNVVLEKYLKAVKFFASFKIKDKELPTESVQGGEKKVRFVFHSHADS
ncbi:MAG: hypothetical protein RXR08_12885 [Sulfolobaceae archaeon]